MPQFALFGNAAVKTSDSRFESTPELRHLATCIARLRSKETELAKDAAIKGDASIDFEKHEAVNKMMESIQAQIDNFNKTPEPANPAERVQALADFAEQIHHISAEVLKEKEILLKTMRNKDRENVNNGMRASAAVPLVTGLFSGALFVTTVINVGIFKVVGDKIRDWSNLTSTVAASYDFTKELVDESAAIVKNLRMTLPKPGI